jgi:Rrf2 family nitric oxide-sensitive transcriptional repressor
MQLNIETDYAIRSILYLGSNPGYAPLKIIAETMAIEKEQLTKIIQKLRDAGLVKGQRGKVGGYTLARPASGIRLLDVILCMEGTIKVNRCLEKDGFCSRKAVPDCPMHHYYCGLQSILEQLFENTTMQDILDGKADAFQALG